MYPGYSRKNGESLMAEEEEERGQLKRRSGVLGKQKIDALEGKVKKVESCVKTQGKGFF